jgi:hypothetical protein
LRLVSTSAITTHAKGAGPDGAILGADKLADIKEPKEGDGRTRYCYANTT